jgi:hypothetical protein
MPSFFQIQLDTTAPQGPVFDLAGGSAIVGTHDVSFVLTTTDPDTTGYQIKLYGDVDPAFNASIQATKAASAWMGYNTINALRLSAGDGAKVIHAVIRDDVGNETADLQDTVTVDTSVPVVTITVPPDHPKISKVATFDTTHFTFTVDSDVTAYKVKVVPNPASTEGQGVQIPPDAGSGPVYIDGTPVVQLAAGVPQAVTITGTDLQTAAGADGSYYIKVFAKEAVTGYWST